VVALHGGSLAFTMPPGADALGRLFERGGHRHRGLRPRLPSTAHGRPRDRPRPHRGLVALADVVKVSAEDLAWLLPGRPPEHVAEGWLAKGPAIVAVTLGPGGVMAVGGAGIVRRPGRRVAIVDTVGAGDSFMSMLLAGLHPRGLLGVDRCAHLGAVDTDTLSAFLDVAVLASAIICTRHGVGPPTVQHLLTGRP
jgi:fructokinase